MSKNRGSEEKPSYERLQEELRACREALEDYRARDEQYHASSMELAMGISECLHVLVEVRQGNLNAQVSDEMLTSKEELLSGLGRELNETVGQLRQQMTRVDEFHTSTMDLAMGISECFQVLSEIRKENYQARISDETLNSGDELMAKLAKAINDTIDKQVDLITRQQYAIQELSTPILQLWDDVLALPVIGVVDTRRSMDIMERLLSEIVGRQSKFVILDITGVEIVDTKTADHFIKLIRAAKLLGTQCIVTGIRPAVAQTLVEIGVDLSSIITLRDLQEGLRRCLQDMERSKRAAVGAN